MRTLFYIAFTIAVVLLGVASIRADSGTPPYTVEQVMKAVFKGEDSINKKVTQGKGTQADYDRLVQYISSLPLNDPPQGDAAGWKQATTALLNAAIALKDGKPGALVQYNQAVNCQACHRIYRPE
jgi:hypothetical protein